VDDDTQSTGLSGWVWYELGRASAEDSAADSSAMRRMFGPKRPSVDVNGLINQNQALAAENARLRQDLADYKLNYSNLKAWANRAEARINQLLKDRS
jgi:hypothetical protein